jgi:hypothetical protein
MFLFAVAGLLPGLLLLPVHAGGAKNPTKGTVLDNVTSKDPEVCTTEGCGKFGTSVEFVKTPSDAAKQALKEEKLVFVLHVSGVFEDPGLT